MDSKKPIANSSSELIDITHPAYFRLLNLSEDEN